MWLAEVAGFYEKWYAIAMEDMALREKYAALLEALPERLAVAFSGGVDSTFLLRAAAEKGDAVALIIDTPFLPRSELAQARELAARIGAPLRAIAWNPLADMDVAGNGDRRCYFCKKALFTRLCEEAAVQQRVLLDGSNLDDTGDYRPGRQALEELNVRSPLLEGGWTKAEIRCMSKMLNLPTADKPAMACLATRIPTDTPLTADALARVESAEDALRALGFSQLRVRDHGEVGRLELDPRDMPHALERAMEIAAAIKAAGYRYAALDLAGYTMGSMNAPRGDEDGNKG